MDVVRLRPENDEADDLIGCAKAYTGRRSCQGRQLSPSLSVQTDRDCYLPSFQSQPGYKPESSGSGQLVSAVVADNMTFPQFPVARLTLSFPR